MKNIKRRIYTLLIAYAVVMSVNLTANYQYYAEGNDWRFSVFFSLGVTTLGWLGYVLLYKLVFKKIINWKQRPNISLALAVVISGIYGVGLMSFIMKALVWMGITKEQSSESYVENCIYSALFSMLIALIINGREFLMQWKRSAEDNERMRAEMIRSQYEVLKTQVNPHFLFNSLNTLAAIIPERPAVAVDFVEQLSKVFRYSLQHSEENTTTVAAEMKIVASYLFLNKQRYDDKLQTDIRIEDGAKDKIIITQSVLMLVENAIKHNEISTDSPLLVSIFTEGDMLVVKNNLQPKRIAEASTNIGLPNIRNRYSLITPKEVQIIQQKDAFIVKIPMLEL
jgi:two-component system, LytTR family, sensor kinase